MTENAAFQPFSPSCAEKACTFSSRPPHSVRIQVAAVFADTAGDATAVHIKGLLGQHIDSAAVAAELDQAAVRREELEKFRDFLAGMRNEIDAVDLTAASATRTLEAIRYRMFTASGRAQAFFISGGASVVGSDPTEPEHKPWREIMRESLPLASAVIIGAVLVSAAFFFALS